MGQVGSKVGWLAAYPRKLPGVASAAPSLRGGEVFEVVDLSLHRRQHAYECMRC